MSLLADIRSSFPRAKSKLDTFYGRFVMRPLSFYLAYLFVKLNFSPIQVTALSLVSGILGIVFLSQSNWFWGLIFLNGWYLLDHVDGGIARFKGSKSATGSYFDDICNVIIQPATCLAIGWGMHSHFGNEVFLISVLGAYGYLLYCVSPVYESKTLLHVARSTGIAVQGYSDRNVQSSEKIESILKRVFMLMHKVTEYPNYLMVLTAMLFLYIVAEEFGLMAMCLLSSIYCGLAFFVSSMRFIHRIYQKS